MITIRTLSLLIIPRVKTLSEIFLSVWILLKTNAETFNTSYDQELHRTIIHGIPIYVA